MQSNFDLDMPPWNSIAAWQEANRSLNFLIQKNLSELDRAMSLAHKVQTRLASIFSILDDLCKATCPWCPDPCCLTAKVWIDFHGAACEAAASLGSSRLVDALASSLAVEVREAGRLGFKRIVLPAASREQAIESGEEIEAMGVESVEEAWELLG